MYNSINYTSSTTLHDTLKSVGGCDSIYKIIAINITPVNPATQTNTLTGCNSILYNSINYTSSTILHDTLKSVGGCDSIYKITNINITPVNPATQANALTGCNSILYNSINYTSSTILHDTLKSVGGCDSIYKITNINVTPVNPATQANTLTGCSSVLYNSINYTSSTILHDTLKSVGGCDSIYKITNINVTPVNPATQTNALAGCSSVLYNSINYTSSTTLHDTLKSIGGCDSIYKIINITITPITPTIQKDSLNGCNSVSYNSITYTASTTLHDTLKSVGGCDSIYKTINITVTPITPVTKKDSL